MLGKYNLISTLFLSGSGYTEADAIIPLPLLCTYWKKPSSLLTCAPSVQSARKKKTVKETSEGKPLHVTRECQVFSPLSFC